MKVYVLFSTEMFDCETRVKMLGVYSTREKVIDRVNDIDLYEIDDVFDEDDEPIIENHNNGYLKAYLNDDFHEYYIDYKEVEVDNNDVSIGVFSVI